jgi:hypothetical protein
MEKKITAKDIINLIREHCEFPEELNEYTADDAIIYPFSTAMEKKYPDVAWDCDSGATKLVLIFKKLGFVIKIPFNVSSDDYYEPCYDDDGNEIEGEGSYCTYPFSGSSSSLRQWDYCHAEIELYAEAKEDDVADYFGAMEEMYDENGEYPLYVQPYITPYKSTGVSDKTFKNEDESRAWSSVRNDFNCGLSKYWVKDFLTYWGRTAYEKLIKFCEDHEIWDLHCGNIGYYGNKPVILDYAGFRD